MIKDSGERRIFSQGATRDISSGKGRFDCIPMNELFYAIDDEFFMCIARFVSDGETEALLDAAKHVIRHARTNYQRDAYASLLELAKLYEKGMEKYGGTGWSNANWRKGIPLSSYVDSACRHYCKWTAGWQDEDHLSACLFNLLSGAWTAENKPEFNNYRSEK